LFEPFFTTKEIGNGTGLGLATVHGIVRQSGGHIEVASVPGRGSCFKIYLPLLPALAPAGVPALGGGVPRGTETVLLAEDESEVRALARLALELSGYTVLSARDGREALEMGDRHAGRIDLLVTDVRMPRLSGRPLADALTARRPELKVLYLSGYLDDVVVRHDVAHHTAALLEKPFTPAQLARKARAVLDGPQMPAEERR
jgi:CheY-like chemotaxis protein